MDKYGTLDDKDDNWIDKAFYGNKLEIKTTTKVILP
jgi:hypothetical protein